jgi:O-antigen/teichoic acid export membrane protein
LFFQYYNYQEVFFGSILIKIIVVLLSTTYLIKYNYIKFHKIKNYTNFKSSKWFSISLFLSQIYDFSDKYLVKTLLGPAALAIYVVPQQLSGKLSIFSKGFSSVLLPSISLSEKKQTQNKSFLLTLKLFIFVLPIILFSFFFYF